MSVPKFQDLWWWDFRAAIDPMSLNNAYSDSIVYIKGRPRPKRFLTEEGRLYKKKWKYIFSTQAPGMPNFRQDNKPEEDRVPVPRVYLDFRWLFLFKDKDFEFSTGRLKGKDLSNLFKLVEDALCEYIGIDDSQTLHLIGDKRRSKLFETQTVVSIKMRLGSPDIEDDPELMERYGRILFPRMESLMTDATVAPSQAGIVQIEDILEDYCTSEEAKSTIRKTLQEFGTDAKMLLTVCGNLYQNQHVKEGLWWALVQRVNAEFAEKVRADMGKAKKETAKKERKARPKKDPELRTLTAKKRGSVRKNDPKLNSKRDTFHAMLLDTKMTMGQLAEACKVEGSHIAWSDATKLVKEYDNGKYGPDSETAKKIGWFATLERHTDDKRDEWIWISEADVGN